MLRCTSRFRFGSKSCPDGPELRLPFCPRKRTQVGHRVRSVSCHNPPPALQKIAITGSILVVPDPRHHLSGMPILAQLASDDVLDNAYEWLCRRRRDYSANSDVWGFRRDWARAKEQIKNELLSRSYRFSLLSRITLKDGDDTDLW